MISSYDFVMARYSTTQVGHGYGSHFLEDQVACISPPQPSSSSSIRSRSTLSSQILGELMRLLTCDDHRLRLSAANAIGRLSLTIPTITPIANSSSSLNAGGNGCNGGAVSLVALRETISLSSLSHVMEGIHGLLTCAGSPQVQNFLV